jgi:hypothetical protein
MEIQMDRIEEAFAHLAGALMQAIPKDDQIIIGHVRDAHDLLRAELRERRADAAPELEPFPGNGVYSI